MDKLILLDTHIWYWFLIGDEKLPKKALKKIEEGGVIVSAISAWELMVLARKKRIKLLPTAEKFVSDAISSYPFEYAPITPQIATLSETLFLLNADPSDRFIVATAHAYKAKLLTMDKVLQDYCAKNKDILCKL